MSSSLTVKYLLATLKHNIQTFELVYEKEPIVMNVGKLAATLTLNGKVLCHLPCIADSRDPLATFKLAFQLMTCKVIGYAKELTFDALRDLESAIRQFDDKFRMDVWDENMYGDTQRLFHALPFAKDGETTISIWWQGRQYRAHQEIALPYSQLYCVKLVLNQWNPSIKPNAIEETLEIRTWLNQDQLVPSLDDMLKAYAASRGLTQ